ncbi:TPA: helix-turn-helix domain-containing protein [Pasteurella multocida]
MKIRNETLTTNIKWTQPTPAEIREVISKSGWNQSETARFLGVTSRQVSRWVQGEAKISYAAWAILCHQAGLGKIWC